jgi:PAS domain S-box-containing protein
MYGYCHDEAIGRSFSLFYTPEDVSSGKPIRELQNAEKEAQAMDEAWHVTKMGSRFWAMTTVTALRSPVGELRGFGYISRDITERMLSEQVLRDSEERFR